MLVDVLRSRRRMVHWLRRSGQSFLESLRVFAQIMQSSSQLGPFPGSERLAEQARFLLNLLEMIFQRLPGTLILRFGTVSVIRRSSLLCNESGQPLLSATYDL